MADSTIHCIGCGDDMNVLSSTFTEFRVSEVLGRGGGEIFKLCQKYLIFPKLSKTRLAHSPWILLIN